MRNTKTMRWIAKALAFVITGALVLGMASTASAQRPRQRVVIVEPVPVFDPFFPYAYPYPYPPDYVSAHYGYVKIDTHRKNAGIYVDGGYAAKTDKVKKFALLPGSHDIELRDSDGRKIFQERVAVIVGKTTKLEVPS